ncbi:hypothetical protein CGZ95_00640 [Enemella evansiae]|uniref:GNAT family N-acetyltransferase n=1 Tax=Enemella evansiae TaxID=2016499 RepID=UPI000B965337|nr:GNAT family N-acetyltransferase [Enemella evansiae]OYO06821.1 hypothetical protein CGZ95_00640 [Enemella evansiae]
MDEHTHGEFVIRRALPADAAAYARADAEMVAETYRDLMPPSFATERLAEVPELTARYATGFAAEQQAERDHRQPERRTWLALHGDRIVGTGVVTYVPQQWELGLGIALPPGNFRQLNHLYLRPEAHGTGLAQTMLDLALPDRQSAHLWVLIGNPRAEAFYRRNGFEVEAGEFSCGPVWYHRPMHRMRRD